MRVTIKGLTDSTITFNTLGIILRGNSAKPELYPNSIARHIDIKTDEQARELIGLKNAKLVQVIDESEEPKVSVSTVDVVNKKVEIQPIKAVNAIKPTILPTPSVPVHESNIIPTEEIEDMPSPQPQEEEEILTMSSKKKAGRPKKTSKSDKIDKAAKVTKKVAIKPIKKLSPVSKPKPTVEEDSKIVVMTPNGPISGNAVNNMAGEMQESEDTRASIEALKQMDSEEATPEIPVDESKLDISQKMGTPAVVATGQNNMVKVPMKNSILPEADAIKNRGIKFIDPNGYDNPPNNSELDESIQDIFIDADNGDQEEGDGFIEC